jgi:hypothetical protein
MKARTEFRRLPKLPPILEIDEDGVPVWDMAMNQPRWSSDAEAEGVQLGDWPTEFDD